MKNGLAQRFARVVALLVGCALLVGIAPPPRAQAADNLDFSVERLAGADRYATAAAISSRFFTPGVPAVFVATGENWPDGLAGGPAAHRLGGPVLFVRLNAIPAPTMAELQRLRPQQIVVLGGAGVVSEAVRGQLATLASGGASRVAGPDRYATAAAIARTFYASAPVVYIATGELFPDALSGGPAAALQGGPLLLTRPDFLPQDTRDQLARLRPARIVVLGGVGAVSAAVESTLSTYSTSVVRLAGADRYGTAVAVAQYAFPAGAPSVFLATGLNFPDALSGVPAAARQKAPILLTPSALPAGVITELGRLDPDTAFLLGGSAVVTVRVAKETQRTLGICWSGFKPPAGSSQVYTLLPATNQIALTFDMGGRLDPAVQIMQFLVENQICATIFPTGASAQTAIGRQVMAVIKAHPELFEVGNHTYLHCNLRDGGGPVGCPTTPPTADFIRSQLTSAETVVRNLTGETSPPYWRPPYGAYNDFVRTAAASVGYTKTVMWHVDTIDWDSETSTDEILSRVLGKATSGSIVLMHLGGYHTLDALPSLVAQLRARGYTLTSISDMLD